MESERFMCSGNCEIRACDCEFVEGNVSKVIEIDKNPSACEIKVDISVEKRRSVRVWGQITDCRGNAVSCALVKLVKETMDCGKKKFEGVAHGITDCLGFYQFDICIPQHCHTEKYRIIVSKQVVGDEIVINGSECDSCNGDNCRCAR